MRVGVGGSPPRGRGKVLILVNGGAFHGITPAWAGKSFSSTQTEIPPQDHPRVGGEKVGKCVQRGRHRGSPPRGRGKVHRCQIGPWLLGITPAWAGKSLSRSATVRSDKDHPRVGGEKLSVCGGICAGLGSPPRGRGKVPPCQFGYIWLGITPAWAGKSCFICFFQLFPWDHPRVGGEKYYNTCARVRV